PEPDGLQTVGQAFPLKVDGGESERGRHSEAGPLQTLAFPFLCRRMVNLEHPNALIAMRVTQRERVQSRAEDHDLTHTAGNARGKRILGKPAARRDKQAPRPQRVVGRDFVQPWARFIIEKFRGQGIAEDDAAIERLMESPISCGAACGLAGLSSTQRCLLFQVAFLRRSSASRILALRASAASRFSFSSSTISSGALATNFSLPSLASTRLMSASALAISLSRRARSAARSITPLSGRAATSPRTRSCTAPVGARSAKEMSDRRAMRLMTSFQRGRRAVVSAEAPASTNAVSVAGAMFISARTERIAVTRSTTQPISASAASSVKSGGATSRSTGGTIASFGFAADISASSSAVIALGLR